LTLQRLFQTLNIKETNISDVEIDICGICSDSRLVKEGDLFVCLRGLKSDGHHYALAALRAGASAVVCEERPMSLPSHVPYVLVENSRLALSLLCDAFYGHPSSRLKLVGVTGTNGKTSTVHILSHIVSFAGKRCGTIGTLDGGLTTPDCEELYRRLADYEESGCEYVFMEVSSHSLMWEKVSALRFDLGIYTNLSGEHLDFHGDMKAYAEAKARLFPLCERALINADDAYKEEVSRYAKNIAFYSCGNPADFRASRAVWNEKEGMGYDFLYPGGMSRIRCPLFGDFNVYNTLAALSASRLLGIDIEAAKGAMSTMPFVKGRLEKIDIGQRDFSVYIDYAHTPDALEKVLKVMKKAKGKGEKLILLFGCGGDRDRGKRRLMGQIASRYADFTVLTADNSRSENRRDIINEILRGIDKESAHIVIEDRKEAIEYCLSHAKTGHRILLAGKGHEEYEITAEGKKPFSEREIVRKYLGL